MRTIYNTNSISIINLMDQDVVHVNCEIGMIGILFAYSDGGSDYDAC